MPVYHVSEPQHEVVVDPLMTFSAATAEKVTGLFALERPPQAVRHGFGMPQCTPKQTGAGVTFSFPPLPRTRNLRRDNQDTAGASLSS